MRKDVLALAAAAVLAGGAQAGEETHPGGATRVTQADAFDRLGTLTGEWQADLPGFGKLSTSIHWVSNGRALEETIGTPADNEVSIYTRQGNKILVTHFCAMTPDGHIVRMSTGELTNSPDRLEFAFIGATNLHSPAAPHMARLLTVFTDHDHFSERWTKTERGKTTTFDLNFVRR